MLDDEESLQKYYHEIGFIPDPNYKPYTNGLARRYAIKGNVSEYMKDDYIANPSKYWNMFYESNTTNFFKGKNCSCLLLVAVLFFLFILFLKLFRSALHT